jgi:transcriptional regulator MraZ
MFAGEFHAHAEAGGLFQLPPIFLAAFPSLETAAGRQVVFLKSLDRSLWLYEARSWDAKLATTRERLDDAQSRLFMDYVVTKSALGELDPHGRFAIPEACRAYAAITTEVVLLSLYERIELWSPARWEAYLEVLIEHRHEPSLGKILDLL